jgi:hypothetical protein
VRRFQHDHTDEQPNNDFRSSVLAEGGRSDVAGRRLQGDNGQELIQELSFPTYRRVATVIFVPAESGQASSVEMVTIDPRDLQEAQDRDAAPQPNPAARAHAQSELTQEKD